MPAPQLNVHSLHVYPIKGARGINLESADVLAQGIQHDRRWLVLDESKDGAFVTQREHPRMALVATSIEGDSLVVSVSSDARVTLPLHPEGPRRRVKIWDDEVDAIDVRGDGAAFFSDYLGRRCSLVQMPLEMVRPVEPEYAEPGDQVGFADGYPVLIANLASLADLNARLVRAGSDPVSMSRFRPNVVIDGGDAYQEETASSVRIGAKLRLRTPKRCARCQVTTVDPSTGATGKEPLRTLASYRTEANKVYFAMNAIPDLTGGAVERIAIGDVVTYE